MSHPQATIAVLDTVDRGGLFGSARSVGAAGAVTLRQPNVYRLSLALARTSRAIAEFFTAGQLGSTGAAERGRWTGARC